MLWPDCPFLVLFICVWQDQNENIKILLNVHIIHDDLQMYVKNNTLVELINADQL